MERHAENLYWVWWDMKSICGADLTAVLLFSFLACTSMYQYVDIISAAWNINIHICF